MGMPGAPALGRAWTVLLCADFVVFIVLTMFRHHDYCSFDSDVSILKPKTRGVNRRKNNPVQ